MANGKFIIFLNSDDHFFEKKTLKRLPVILMKSTSSTGL